MKRESVKASARLSGALLGVQHGCVYGWAAGGEPGQTLAVEIVGDDEVLLLARTGLPLPASCSELPLPEESGFVALIGEERLDCYERITARLANLDLPLEGVYLPHGGGMAPARGCEAGVKGARGGASRRPSLQGVVQHRGGLQLSGWALPEIGARQSVQILALENGQLVAQAWADRRDASQAELGLGLLVNGFDLTLPLALADGQPHRLTVCTSAGEELAGSPLEICLAPAGDQNWLRSLPLPAADRDVLLAIAARWQRLLPLSLEWSAYPAWKTRFGEPPPVADCQARVAVVVAGPPDRAAATLHSAAAQTLKAAQVLVAAKTRPSVLSRALAQADFVAVVLAGDAWQPRLLEASVHTLQNTQALVSYCDADDESGGPPWFKPDWCPDTFAALPLLDHGFVCKAETLRDALAANKASGKSGENAVQWPRRVGEHLLRSGHASRRSIVHVAYPLHHCGGGVTASGQYPCDITWPDPGEWPAVTVVIPTRDQVHLLRACVESLLATDYPNLRICVVDNQTVCPDALAYLGELAAAGAAADATTRIDVLRWDAPFNFASINNWAVSHVHSDFICLVNNDVRALDTQWLRHMVRKLSRPGVAAVGAKLLWPNGMVQHVGVPLGLHGLAGHTGNQWLASDAGYHHCNQITRTVSAVTAACLLLRRADYLAVGGMDADAFPVNFNDMDLCLKLGEQVGRVVVTPDAVLEHAESVSRGQDETPARRARVWREHMALYRRWARLIDKDPYYNPNLNLDRYSHAGLAFPPRHVAAGTSL